MKLTDVQFGEPEGASPLQTETLSEGLFERRRSIDYVSGTETYEILSDTGLERHLHTGLEVQFSSNERYTIHPDDPNSAVGTCAWTMRYSRQQWYADVSVSVTVSALRAAWQIDATLSACDAQGVVADKTWSETIKRDLV